MLVETRCVCGAASAVAVVMLRRTTKPTTIARIFRDFIPLLLCLGAHGHTTARDRARLEHPVLGVPFLASYHRGQSSTHVMILCAGSRPCLLSTGAGCSGTVYGHCQR